MDTQTDGEIAATKKTEAVPADGYTTRDERPASRENRKPDGDDRRDIPPPPPQPRTCFVSFRDADFAAPPCYR